MISQKVIKSYWQGPLIKNIWTASLGYCVFVDRMWGQHGGHMEAVEANRCGVTWALSFDQTPFVYNGGYGNILTRGKFVVCHCQFVVF